MYGQGTKCRRNIAENYNRLSRVHERYRQTDDRQTDGRETAYNRPIEREHKFTFARNVPHKQAPEVKLRLGLPTIAGENTERSLKVLIALIGCRPCGERKKELVRTRCLKKRPTFGLL